MADLFASAEMALGYARARPPLHALILKRACAGLPVAGLALDLGCGAGLSSAPLARYARRVAALDPNERMLGLTGAVAPEALPVAAAAEHLPFPAGTFDLITAAGSLNFTDLELSLPELSRVLTKRGRLLIYDFAMGRDFPDSAALSAWHAEFVRRYPTPPARAIHPSMLPAAQYGLRLEAFEEFTIPLTLEPAFYLDYVMTETNVAAAIAAGTPEADIRDWCARTLAPVFAGSPREVLFSAYTAFFRSLLKDPLAG